MSRTTTATEKGNLPVGGTAVVQDKDRIEDFSCLYKIGKGALVPSTNVLGWNVVSAIAHPASYPCKGQRSTLQANVDQRERETCVLRSCGNGEIEF